MHRGFRKTAVAKAILVLPFMFLGACTIIVIPAGTHKVIVLPSGDRKGTPEGTADGKEIVFERLERIKGRRGKDSPTPSRIIEYEIGPDGKLRPFSNSHLREKVRDLEADLAELDPQLAERIKHERRAELDHWDAANRRASNTLSIPDAARMQASYEEELKRYIETLEKLIRELEAKKRSLPPLPNEKPSSVPQS